MKEGLIEQAWQQLAKVLELEPFSPQCTDMRNSFFAGAYTIMTIMRSIGTNYDDDNAETDVALIESLHQECQVFKAEVTYNPEQN